LSENLQGMLIVGYHPLRTVCALESYQQLICQGSEFVARRQLLQTGTASTAVACRIVEFRPEAWSAQCLCTLPALHNKHLSTWSMKIFHACHSPIN